MSALVSLLLVAGGVALVIAGAEAFFSGLVASATRLRVSPFALAVVISGFEIENVVAGIVANLEGFGSVAAGTFLGGTTFLALAVPGLSAVLAPIETRLPMSALSWTVAAPLPLLGLGWDGELSRVDGVLLLVWFAVCIGGLAISGRRLPFEELDERVRRPVLKLLAGLAVLSGGGFVLGEGIRRVVDGLGVSQSLFGNAALAPATEAEEVARVAVPSRHGRGDVALANVLGTIVHFAALNAGLIALVRPIEFDSPTRSYYLPMAALSVFVLVAAIGRRGLSRRDGIVLLVAYAAYVTAAIVVSG